MTSAPQPPSSAPSFSAEDIQVATDLLMQPLDGEVKEIVTLTDEELMALDGFQNDPLTPTPWVAESARGEESRALVTATAMRSMIARGIVTSAVVNDPRRDDAAGEEQASMVAVPELQGTAVLRRTSDAVIIAERRTERGTAYGYFYLFHMDGEVRVLWEVFDATGFHLFFLMDGAALPEQFIAFIDPAEGIGETDEEPVEVPASEFGSSPTAARLAESRAMTTILVLEREGAQEPTAFTLFSGGSRVALMEEAGEGEDAVRRVGTVSRSTLEALLQDVVAATAPEGSGTEDPQE